jgi:hypothetical protein
MQQFARSLIRDIETVRNAIAEPWSSGQAEGQCREPFWRDNTRLRKSIT